MISHFSPPSILLSPSSQPVSSPFTSFPPFPLCSHLICSSVLLSLSYPISSSSSSVHICWYAAVMKVAELPARNVGGCSICYYAVRHVSVAWKQCSYKYSMAPWILPPFLLLSVVLPAIPVSVKVLHQRPKKQNTRHVRELLNSAWSSATSHLRISLLFIDMGSMEKHLVTHTGAQPIWVLKADLETNTNHITMWECIKDKWFRSGPQLKAHKCIWIHKQWMFCER